MTTGKILATLSMHIGEFLPCQLYIIDLTPVEGGVVVRGQNVAGAVFERTARSEADVRAILEGPP